MGRGGSRGLGRGTGRPEGVSGSGTWDAAPPHPKRQSLLLPLGCLTDRRWKGAYISSTQAAADLQRESWGNERRKWFVVIRCENEHLV